MTTSRIGIVEPEQPSSDEAVVIVPVAQAPPASLQRDEEFWRVWQQRLLPFMAAMTAVFAIFFLIATAVQLYQLQERVDAGPKLNVSEIFAVAAPPTSGQGAPEMLRWHALAALEGHALALRYHQANVLLISRVWTSYLGFLTGIILALIGAVFVLGRLESQDNTLEISGGGWSGLFKSNAPGLILAVLGTLLMVTTLVKHNESACATDPSTRWA